MWQKLLSKYRSTLGFRHDESDNFRQNQASIITTNWFYGDLMMRFLLFGWIVFQTYTYHYFSDRPDELFAPINWFDKLFMPTFPHVAVWYAVVFIALFANFRLLLNGERKWERIALAILVMWINCIRWKYEFFSHVGHLIVLYHLLGMFIPRKRDVKKKEFISYSKAIRWLYGGILVTYTLSGLWKVVGLVYKYIMHPDHINWLHPLAMKINAIVHYRDNDIDMWDGTLEMYDVMWPWQVAFVLMLILQVTSVVGAIRPQLLPYMGFGNILFHLANIILLNISFYVAIFSLLVMFFPYHLIFKRDALPFDKKVGKGTYERYYEDGTKDEYTGYYAFREKLYDKKPLLAGVFYFPGLSLIGKVFFR